MSERMRNTYYTEGSAARVMTVPPRKPRRVLDPEGRERVSSVAAPKRELERPSTPVRTRTASHSAAPVKRTRSSARPATQKTRPATKPTVKPQTKKQTQKKKNVAKNTRVSHQAERALAFNFKYAAYVVLAVGIMMVASVMMLGMESRITKQRQEISGLESELDAIKDDNAAYKVRLENMYSLDTVYDIATNELGMVYAKRGQIVYYDSANEDYVKQYQDVPESN